MRRVEVPKGVCAILPALGHLRVGSVVRADIVRFFREYGRRKPGGANRSHEILHNMFDLRELLSARPVRLGQPAARPALLCRSARAARSGIAGRGDRGPTEGMLNVVTVADDGLLGGGHGAIGVRAGVPQAAFRYE